MSIVNQLNITPDLDNQLAQIQSALNALNALVQQNTDDETAQTETIVTDAILAARDYIIANVSSGTEVGQDTLVNVIQSALDTLEADLFVQLQTIIHANAVQVTSDTTDNVSAIVSGARDVITNIVTQEFVQHLATMQSELVGITTAISTATDDVKGDISSNTAQLQSDITSAQASILSGVALQTGEDINDAKSELKADIAAIEGGTTGAIESAINDAQSDIQSAIAASEIGVKSKIAGDTSALNTNIINAINALRGNIGGDTSTVITAARNALYTRIDTRASETQASAASNIDQAKSDTASNITSAANGVNSNVNSKIAAQTTGINTNINNKSSALQTAFELAIDNASADIRGDVSSKADDTNDAISAARNSVNANVDAEGSATRALVTATTGSIEANQDAHYIDILGQLVNIELSIQNQGFNFSTSNASAAPDAPIRNITVRAFRARFSLSEKIQIETSTDPIIRIFEKDLMSSWYVDLDMQDVIDGLDYLASTGVNIIDEARIAQIRADGVDSEKP